MSEDWSKDRRQDSFAFINSCPDSTRQRRPSCEECAEGVDNSGLNTVRNDALEPRQSLDVKNLVRGVAWEVAKVWRLDVLFGGVCHSLYCSAGGFPHALYAHDARRFTLAHCCGGSAVWSGNPINDRRDLVL